MQQQTLDSPPLSEDWVVSSWVQPADHVSLSHRIPLSCYFFGAQVSEWQNDVCQGSRDSLSDMDSWGD